MEFSISSLLALILWDSLCVRSKTAAHTISQESLETLLHSQTKRLQVRPENSVHTHPGQKLTLRCGGEGDEVLEQFWQTPFGLFDGCNHQNKDPVDTCNGTLRISRATSSHDGLYYCVRLDEMSKTIVPYRVNIVKRKTREAGVYSDTVSESHFAAAVASSVIVSFLVAFTLGAFSRSYVMKCLRTIRARMPRRKDNHTHINGQTNLQATRAQTDTVFFHKNQTTGEDTVDIGLVDQERMDVDNADATGNGKNESNEPQSCEGEEQTPKLRSAVSPHPKKIRVIKLYNYDEEGNPYNHIKDSGMEGEGEVRPKLRTRSLTRLNAIMKQAEALDLNPDRESTDGRTIQADAPSHEDSVSDTAGDTFKT
ncbi:uncharacterized protein LOC131524684 [Onychostoma macrolepis]|uniref:Ig-like domain-containing protein n=1 Tax=Onychostoma macrolepis TaxID=369639 RepID=A0A7J6C1D3_9TELE|nr:uncharacterized protein LOC131524684 [Onychostoma macrolepis]XP_058607921.1 uncharacterized protein LOC131524684 [Onychostoma macrolepis]KAF4101067.1 hypothetical protein G5714_017499 [Onychostoma macrolepis]